MKFFAKTLITVILTLSASFSIFASDNLKIVLVPSENSNQILKQSNALIQELKNKLGVEIEGVIATDYNALIESIRSSNVDISYLGPFSYVKAEEYADVETFVVTETKKGRDVTYHNQIIVPANAKDIDITTLKNLKNNDFPFTSQISTSDNISQYIEFKETGIISRDLLKDIILMFIFKI